MQVNGLGIVNVAVFDSVADDPLNVLLSRPSQGVGTLEVWQLVEARHIALVNQTGVNEELDLSTFLFWVFGQAGRCGELKCKQVALLSQVAPG